MPPTKQQSPYSIFQSAPFWIWAMVVLFGCLLGLGVYTFFYGEGLSYFSKDPRACVNCHIMQPQYDSWQKASHHTVANCVDCHLPHKPIPKLIAKAENGFWHSKGFTFQDFPEPIFIREKNMKILQENCMDCHRGFVHTMQPVASGHEEAVSCVHCHRDVGHGETVGLGKYEPVDPLKYNPSGKEGYDDE